MTDIQIVTPKGMFGPAKDYTLDAILRIIAEEFGQEGEWASKYGTNVDNFTFMMHRYCWCDQEDCPWCSGDAPNFHYKPTGLKVSWYKYIGRSMEASREVSNQELAKILWDCLQSKE